MNNSKTSAKIIGTIDCTPTWQSLLNDMLTVYAETSSIETRTALRTEFAKMAKGADWYIALCNKFPNEIIELEGRL